MPLSHGGHSILAMHDTARVDIQVDSYAGTARSLRVAYVTETWPPEVNGVSLTAARMVEGLQRRQHEVQLVRPRQSADGDGAATQLHEVLMRGLPIPRYPQLRLGLPAQRQLLALWATRRPDVVHVATEGPLGWSAVQAARRLRLPVTSDFRTNFHAYSAHYGVGWLRKPIMVYLRKFHNRTLATMVPTEPLRRELTAAGFRNVQVVARGVDTRGFAPAFRSDELRRSWQAGPDDLVVLCVGRLAAEKNLPLLARAFDAIRREDPRARLVLVGEGPQRAELARALPEACFAGQQRGAALAAHYASADLFVFPSLTETFGNVTAEAMASALPVLAFDYAAAAQLIRSGESGMLVPFGDEDEFVRGAVVLARSQAHRRALAAAARRRALLQDWDDVIVRFESELLRACLQAQPTAWPAMARLRATP